MLYVGISILAALLLYVPVIADPTTTYDKKGCVIVLHGMARTASSMHDLETYLSNKGYRTVNFACPSTSESIERIAEAYLPRAIAQCEDGPIHFVTHSLGGIVARQYLQTNGLPKGSRIVMLAPPNRGTEVNHFLTHGKFDHNREQPGHQR